MPVPVPVPALLLVLSACGGRPTESGTETGTESDTDTDTESGTGTGTGTGTGSEPDTPAWNPEPGTRFVRVEPSAHALPEGAPSCSVHVPDAIDASRPVELVVFFHGWSGCVASLTAPGRTPCTRGARAREGWNLAGVHDRAGKNSVLCVPQLAWLARDGSPGRFREPGVFASFLRAALRDGRGPPLDAIASITLVAHSAGYEAVLALLRTGDLGAAVRRIVLLDALYAGSDEIAAWVVADASHVVVSLYTGERSTYEQSQALARRATATLGEALVANEPAVLAEAIASRRVIVARATSPHGAIPMRELAGVLASLPALAQPAPLR